MGFAKSKADVVFPGSPDPPFWDRQFAAEPTLWQNVFDVVVAVVLLPLALFYDPFHTFGGMEWLSLGRFQFFVYCSIGLEIFFLVLWLRFRERTGVASGIIAGILLAGVFLFLCAAIPAIVVFVLIVTDQSDVFSPAVVVVLVLGLTPLPAMFVFLRNGVRALKRARARFRGPMLAALLALGPALVLAGPAAIQCRISLGVLKCIHQVRADDLLGATATAKGLEPYRRCGLGNFDPMVIAYAYSQGEDVKALLEFHYRSITGADIEKRWSKIRF